MIFLDPSEWGARMQAHQHRADELLAAYRHPGEKHPVYDFLFNYYPVRPKHLRQWHPGVGVKLLGPVEAPHASWRDYVVDDTGVALDIPAFWARRGDSMEHIRTLMENSAANPSRFECFGLHEWAMLYKSEDARHDLPLRLGQAGTDEVVETHRIRCSHYDAFRFFTPPARPLNLTVLHREDQVHVEQAGCVHATMDLYKWAWKMGPLVPGELFLDTLELAVDARILDMEASPYDCRELGFSVVAIETTEGKAEYVRRQRALADRAKPMRSRLVALIEEAKRANLSSDNTVA